MMYARVREIYYRVSGACDLCATLARRGEKILQRTRIVSV
jgi:hypothetical protein